MHMSEEEINLVNNLTLSVNQILKKLFYKIELDLVDFKLEFGRNLKGEIILGDEFSPDNCRLWDHKSKNVKIKSLDKDLFRNDLGDLIQAYSEINNRINNFIRSNQKI